MDSETVRTQEEVLVSSVSVNVSDERYEEFRNAWLRPGHGLALRSREFGDCKRSKEGNDASSTRATKVDSMYCRYDDFTCIRALLFGLMSKYRV
ncbi:hypothetical protein Mp_1g04440 [Marchantia polymorpha subsp. ruderalis]|uniref:Uncharacterized protein n=2 Tax=Marchantia polymorpha TaxID=3197 RepID=A0AAF6ALG4_MARPO|nr:hypothetical protein MARPO_0005s0163 [Marchantia polymorpha]BBM97284.1 hypothetical protein Mp_1g04440 [Marchantia polymorpha subsp. ruderalis]|eukprot:PTQ48523.1 hypothetical protein MARPO_0005s0163 [Marchantia polymorpha]